MGDIQEESPYKQQLEEYHEFDTKRHAFMTDLLAENDRLLSKLTNIQVDYENEQVGRRYWQQQAGLKNPDVPQPPPYSTPHPFVVVIIDGDAAIFKNEFYERNRDGGSDAAFLIRAYIRGHLQRKYTDIDTSTWPVIVHLVLSAQGLASKLFNCKIIDHATRLYDVGYGWVSQTHCIWTDVGPGKERADHKIKEELQMYMPMAQCKNVYFGPCVDNGYLAMLEAYKPDKSMSTKIVLLETRPGAAGFDKLGFDKVQIAPVFRETNLPERPPNGKVNSPSLKRVDLANSTSLALTRIVQPASTKSVQQPIDKLAQSPSIPSTRSSSASEAWITVVGKKHANRPATKVDDVGPKFILFNRAGERVDADLPAIDPAAASRFATHTADMNYCNNYHLLGRCHNTEKTCNHIHGVRLTGEELVVLQYKARGIKCEVGMRCKDFSCIYGHHCRLKKDCTFAQCWFGEHSTKDYRPVKKIQEGCADSVKL